MASASYREPRPHARSAAARQEKTRGRRRISRKAPDLPHDAVRAGAESDERLHTGTTSPEGHSGPSMGKGQLGPFAQSSPPGSHWGIRGTGKVFLRVGGNWFPRTSLIDNQPRRTRRPCPCRQLLPSVAGSGGGMPHGMRSRLDGVWTRARNLFHFPPPFQPSITGCPSGAGKRYRPSAHHTFAYPGVVPAFSASSCCPALRLTLAPRAVCPLCLNHPPL